jgi:hypothetical protein
MASASILNTGKAMYAWNGTNWLPLNAQNNLLNSTRWSKVAIGGETTISGYDDNGLNLSYSPGYEQLFLNGILLVRNIDYTATNGTSIDGLTAISAGSNIDIISFQSISLANVYTKGQVDSMVGDIDLSSAIQTASAAAVTYLVDGAPAALNTLNELAEALNDNSDILDLYLTQSSASSTYLTQSNASATYTPINSTIKLNTQTIESNYTMPVGYNGYSAGPITISASVVVTIPPGSSWSII